MLLSAMLICPVRDAATTNRRCTAASLISIFTSFLFVGGGMAASAQPRHELGFYGGLGVNFSRSMEALDEQHYGYKKPVTLTLGISYEWKALVNTSFIAKLGITRKTVKLVYNFNESAVPYEYSSTYKELYNAPGLWLGIRHRPRFIRGNRIFCEAGVGIEYYTNTGIGFGGGGNGGVAPLEDTIFYSTLYENHLGQARFGGGAFTGVGAELGKKRRSEVFVNITVPFTALQRTSSALSDAWTYNGTTYSHHHLLRTSVVYASVGYGYVLFRR
jgi:hypothetical protein